MTTPAAVPHSGRPAGQVRPVSATSRTPTHVPANMLAKEIIACIEKGDSYGEKSEQFYKTAGLKLIEARKRVPDFKAFLAKCGGLSRSRAYELISIGSGKKTLEEVRERSRLSMAEGRAAPFGRNIEGPSSSEWYTPPEYFPMAIEVMGKIDLCPASIQPLQDEVLPGVPCYTKKTNGLDKPWPGRVWLNPPYGTGLIEPFIDKLVAELKSGRTTQAILLVNNCADTAWFRAAVKPCAAICFPKRIPFYDPTGKPSAPSQGQAFLYYGPNRRKFFNVFKGEGFILPGPMS
jgi:hypothetical protein